MKPSLGLKGSTALWSKAKTASKTWFELSKNAEREWTAQATSSDDIVRFWLWSHWSIILALQSQALFVRNPGDATDQHHLQQKSGMAKAARKKPFRQQTFLGIVKSC
jgi:hypothetical protein